MALRIVVALAGVLALLAVGCSSNPGSAKNEASGSSMPVADATSAAASVPTDTTDPTCGEVPVALAGKWTKVIQPQDLPPEYFDADTGVFVMTLGPGHYVRTDVDSDHRGQDEELCWTPDLMVYVPHGDDCSGNSIGVYEWKLSGNSLSLTTVKDACVWRPFLSTFATWTRVSQ